MECVDSTSGYPYYWNRETNEVKWDRPSELPPISTSPPLSKKPNLISNQHASNNQTSKNNDNSSLSKISKVSTIETKKVKKKSRSATPPQVFIGPTLPQVSLSLFGDSNIHTGKSLSETLIFASTDPQYDDRLFIELSTSSIDENSKLRTWGEHVVIRNCF